MGHLNNALSHLTSNLPNNWIDGFAATVASDDVNVEQNVIDAKLNTSTIINPALNSLFDDLNLSILSGEYVNDIPQYRSWITDLEDYISNNVANFDIPNYPNILAVCQEQFTGSFLNPVKKSLTFYKMLLESVERHLVFKPNTSTILMMLKDDYKDIDIVAKDLVKILSINASLARIDHSIRFEKECFSSLIRIEENLKGLNTLPIAEILSKKCRFLLYKLSFRLQQSQQDYLYSIDFNYTKVSPTEEPEFQRFNDIIKGHYDDSIIKPYEFKQRLASALGRFEQSSPTLIFDDFHCLIKHFKDEKKDLGALESVKLLYEQYYNTHQSSASAFNKRAYDITYCYIENNILSLELDKGLINITNWELKLAKYTDRANLSKNRNFFPYYKIIKEYLGKEILDQLLKSDSEKKIIKNLIEEYQKNLSKLIENVGTCWETEYLAFQNDYVNCIITINDSSHHAWSCFISSSFVLPLNYKEINEELDNYKADLIKFKTMLDIRRLTDLDRKDIQTVKQEIEKTDKRHIEILSIFAALVMFVSNEIQIFTKIPNMGDAVAYTLFFAFGLGLFVLMIWFITRPDGVKFKTITFMQWFVIGLFSLGFMAAVVYVLKNSFSNNAQKKQLELMDFKIDSLKKSKVIDTLSFKLKKVDTIRK